MGDAAGVTLTPSDWKADSVPLSATEAEGILPSESREGLRVMGEFSAVGTGEPGEPMDVALELEPSTTCKAFGSVDPSKIAD